MQQGIQSGMQPNLQPGMQQGLAYGMPGGPPAGAGAQQAGTSGMAITALVLGVLGLVIPILGIVALVLGLVAIGQIDRMRLKGGGLARAGAIIGGIGILTSGVLVVMALLFPALGAARRSARSAVNSTQLRGIHQSMVTYSQANKFWFPGATPTGKVGPAAVDSLRGASLGKMVADDYYAPEYLISPGETDPNVTADARSTAGGALWLQGEYQGMPDESTMGSFAVLDYTAGNAAEQSLSHLGKLEWRESFSSAAVILSDRHFEAKRGRVIKGDGKPDSVWATSGDTWSGSMMWNDNHVTFETQTNAMTAGGDRYGSGSDTRGSGTIGDLFQPADGTPTRDDLGDQLLHDD